MDMVMNDWKGKQFVLKGQMKWQEWRKESGKKEVAVYLAPYFWVGVGLSKKQMAQQFWFYMPLHFKAFLRFPYSFCPAYFMQSY